MLFQAWAPTRSSLSSFYLNFGLTNQKKKARNSWSKTGTLEQLNKLRIVPNFEKDMNHEMFLNRKNKVLRLSRPSETILILEQLQGQRNSTDKTYWPPTCLSPRNWCLRDSAKGTRGLCHYFLLRVFFLFFKSKNKCCFANVMGGRISHIWTTVPNEGGVM